MCTLVFFQHSTEKQVSFFNITFKALVKEEALAIETWLSNIFFFCAWTIPSDVMQH